MTRFPKPPAAAGSATSRAAATAIESHAPSQRRRIHEFIAMNPCCTRDEIGDALGIDGNSLRPRVRELIDRGHVRVVDDAGKTKTGRKAERLMITAKRYSESPPRPAVQQTLPGIDRSARGE